MDFIPPISSPAHPPLKVPWFSPRNKAYKPSGYREWLFYPHYEGYNIQHIVEGDFHGNTWADTAGFIQRWAYCGMIVEIFRIGGMLGLENEDLSGTEQLRKFSASLPYLIMLWRCIRTDPANPEKEQIELGKFVEITVILKRVNVFFTLLCKSEIGRLRARRHEDGADGQPHKAQLMYARHSHQHEAIGDWDVQFAEGPPEGKSFFSEEPLAARGGNTPTHELESPGHALLLSIGVAGELLQKATEQKYDRKIDGLKWTTPLTIVRRAHYAGWCPIWLRRFREEGSIIRAYYLSAISKGPIDRHSHCCAFGCIANQVNPVTYQMRHRASGCDCPAVSFELTEKSAYADWIKAGHTPLILRREDDFSLPAPATKDWRRWTGIKKDRSPGNDHINAWELIRSHEPPIGKARKYVAISHVWVDGTGSGNGNSLYSCQLDKFQDAVNELYRRDGEIDEPIPFWVDTISVPFKRGPLKMLALRQMEQVYREADRVLVFDSGLQQAPLGIPAHECLSRIEISSWNERLWTIQEAVFAKKLYFKFEDGIISLQDLIFRYRLERFSRIGALRFGPGSESLLAGVPLLRIILDSQLEPVLKKEDHATGELCKPPGISGGDWLVLDSTALDGPISKVEMDGLILDTVFFGTIVAVLDFFETLRESQSGSTIAQVKWSSLEKVLPNRQTSVASDEGLCIATLLGMDLKALYDLEDEERLRRTFLHIGTVSPSILFGDRPRLEQKGCRWMPTSFVGQRIEQSKSMAHVIESGVKAKLPSLLVEFPSPGFMLDIRPGNVKGPYGFVQLRSDDRDRPGHLVAGSFPLRLCGTGLVFSVDLTLPENNPGFITPTSKIRIMLEEPLSGNKPPEVGSSLVQRNFAEWRQLQQKTLIEGFLVQMKDGDSTKVEYGLPLTLSSFDDPTPGQIAAAAQATQMEEIEWLIS